MPASKVDTFVNEFMTVLRADLSSQVEDEESLTSLVECVQSSLSRYMETHNVPARPRQRKQTVVQSSETRDSSETVKPTTETTETTESSPKKTRKVRKTSSKKSLIPKLSGYNMFVQYNMSHDPQCLVKRELNAETGEHTGLESKDKMRHLSRLWKELTDEQHGEWNTKASVHRYYLNQHVQTPETETNLSDRLKELHLSFAGLSAEDYESWTSRCRAHEAEVAAAAIATTTTTTTVVEPVATTA